MKKIGITPIPYPKKLSKVSVALQPEIHFLSNLTFYFLLGDQTLGEEFTSLVRIRESSQKRVLEATLQRKRCFWFLWCAGLYSLERMQRGENGFSQVKQLFKKTLTARERAEQFRRSLIRRQEVDTQDFPDKASFRASLRYRVSSLLGAIRKSTKKVPLESIVKFGSSAQLLMFFYSGKYYSPLEQMLRLRYISTKFETNTSLSLYKFLAYLVVVQGLLLIIVKVKKNVIERQLEKSLDKDKVVHHLSPKGLKCGVCFSDPVEDPTCGSCGHIFCWSCVLSCAFSSSECPMCRKDIKVNELSPVYFS
eukprot:snap_masked-scaffold_12-processed-gene-10.34-mRNA-1 protein AED:1.00 eAED:1.00 QI:0/0/0/0/1/1/2/0/306